MIPATGGEAATRAVRRRERAVGLQGGWEAGPSGDAGGGDGDVGSAGGALGVGFEDGGAGVGLHLGPGESGGGEGGGGEGGGGEGGGGEGGGGEDGGMGQPTTMPPDCQLLDESSYCHVPAASGHCALSVSTLFSFALELVV